MDVLITGSTGFLGGEILILLAKHPGVDRVFCLVRAGSEADGLGRLRKVFGVHGDSLDTSRVIPVPGDLLDPALADRLQADPRLKDIRWIIHAAADTSFGKIHDDVVQKTNVEGLARFAAWAARLPRLDTFMYIGTASIIGKEAVNRVIREDESPDPCATHLVRYTRTKMEGEQLLQQILGPERLLVVRPSIIMGDSRGIKPRSFVILWALAAADLLRLVPVDSGASLDAIPVDFAAEAIIRLMGAQRRHTVYHISAGRGSATTSRKLTDAIAVANPERPPFRFVDHRLMAEMKLWAKGRLFADADLFAYAAYLKYWDAIFPDRRKLRLTLAGFEPYSRFINLSQVFDNARLLDDAGIAPPEPAHSYISRNVAWLGTIDIMEGALDP